MNLFENNAAPNVFTDEKLSEVLRKMLGANIFRADFTDIQLQGGTVGDIRLVSGCAETIDGEKLPYKIVLKIQKKWERYGDPDSWRREYDFYKSDFGVLFSDSFRWPVCYHAEMNDDETETQLWMEYIDGISGVDLTGGMYEQAARELGRFQGKLYAERPAALQQLTNLSKVEFMKNFYLHYRSWDKVYDYIRTENCELPKRLRKMITDIDENENEVWRRIEKLPIVLCHRDFWVTNIIHKDNKIILIDWDTAGWGYMGEDIASLIADEADIEHMVEYYSRCVPAYYKGFAEYADISHITGWSDASHPARPCILDKCVYELILLMFGYRIVAWYMEEESGNSIKETDDERALALNTLQKIYEMRDIKI